jgi:hypothetical protein
MSIISSASQRRSDLKRPIPGAAGLVQRGAPDSGAPAVRRLGVPWSTVLSLAVVLAFADGFWLTSLRGAVGAIERTQSPFSSWWRESTLMVPVFVVAVLGALMLARRWFGAMLRPPAVLATVGLVVAAGTVVGLVEIVVSSAYDYHLQSLQMQLMGSMKTMCTTRTCLVQEEHDTLAVHIRGVLYVSRWLLLTNLVLVGWLVAMRGGRIKLSGRARSGLAAARFATRDRADQVRLLLVAALGGAALIHAAVIPEHLREWGAAGVFFIVLTGAELTLAALLLRRAPDRRVLLAARAVSLLPLLMWLWSRTAGMPFGPGAGIPEPIGLPDLAACALELTALIAAIVLLTASTLTRRPRASAYAGALATAALIAVTTIGLTGTNVAFFNTFTAPTVQSGMNMPH